MMNASKENAQKSLDNLLTQERFMNEYAFGIIKGFLEAAKKKLPSEAAFEKEKNRRDVKKAAEKGFEIGGRSQGCDGGRDWSDDMERGGEG